MQHTKTSCSKYPSSNWTHSKLYCIITSSVYLFLTMLDLGCCVQVFSSCREQGLLSSCGVRASDWGGFSRCRAQALGAWASVAVVHGLSSCCSQALEHRLRSCSAWAWLLHGMWVLPGPGIEPMSPALAVRFFTTEPPGKPLQLIFACLPRTM